MDEHSPKKRTPLMRYSIHTDKQKTQSWLLIDAGIVQSVERLTAERVVTGSIPGAGPILRVLK